MLSTSSSLSTRTLSVGKPLTTRYPYEPPVWARDKFETLPSNRLHMSNLPTPLYRWAPVEPSASKSHASSITQRLRDLNITLYIKRDDMTGGCETGGNKIRKLEFLLADALENGYDKVMTIGGEQSNHCRATASACRMLGLEPHLILRTERANDIQKAPSEAEGGLGYAGNILFDRLVGSRIYTCTPGEYGRIGSRALLSRLCDHVEKTSDGKVYPIPVGGSNGLGTWGYIDGVDEVLSQWRSIESEPSLDHVLFACGSGGTAAGIAVGMALAFEHELFKDSKPPTVHAMGVCDSPDYFYNYVAGIADEMGIVLEGGGTTEEYIRQHMTVHQGKGLGYAASTPEELEFISALALETGVVLDPVYSGKALYHFVKDIMDEEVAGKYRGANILFWHTGGALGMFAKADTLTASMAHHSPVKRLDIYGKGGLSEIDISQSTDISR
jgi:D-cysteine desulfhydrase